MSETLPNKPALDWLLYTRYALLIGMCALIPLPIVDGWVENVLRRRLVRAVARRHGHQLDADAAALLGDAPTGGCVGCLFSVLWWPVKKLLKTLSVVFQVKGIADTTSEVVHRGLLLEEAFENGWLPGDAARVRQAMDKAFASVDTRPMERKLIGPLRDVRGEWNLAIWESVRIARARAVVPPIPEVSGETSALLPATLGAPADGLWARARLRFMSFWARRPLWARSQALADAADADALGPHMAEASRSMAAALKTVGLVPEVVAWFRAEMGAPPKLEPRLAGPIDPEVLPADAPATDKAPLALVEDAIEVEPKR